MTDTVFAGSIPKLYDELLVPLIFAPYAADIAQRAAARKPTRVLELAAGTGAVTRALLAGLPEGVPLVATDLNQAMLDRAAAVGTSRPIEFRAADAMSLPFADASFDLVVCQFGVMFFPDKAKAFAETRRVLKPGGTYLFNAWDRIEDNEFADEVTRALGARYPKDPPRFMARTPHGYHDRDVIARDVAAGGFTATPTIDTVTARSRATSAQVVAAAYCQGTPLRGEIESRDPLGLYAATETSAVALAARFGSGAVDGKIQAHVVAVAR